MLGRITKRSGTWHGRRNTNQIHAGGPSNQGLHAGLRDVAPRELGKLGVREFVRNAGDGLRFLSG